MALYYNGAKKIVNNTVYGTSGLFFIYIILNIFLCFSLFADIIAVMITYGGSNAMICHGGGIRKFFNAMSQNKEKQI
jgi:hypothetical protein